MIEDTGPLPPGTPAPDLALLSTPDEAVSPADFRGRPVVLVFHPADWSPVCTDQLALYQEVMPELVPATRANMPPGR